MSGTPKTADELSSRFLDKNAVIAIIEASSAVSSLEGRIGRLENALECAVVSLDLVLRPKKVVD